MLPAENLDNKIKEFWPKNGPPAQEAEKYVKKYLNEKIVIKCGGKVLLDPALFKNFTKPRYVFWDLPSEIPFEIILLLVFFPICNIFVPVSACWKWLVNATE